MRINIGFDIKENGLFKSGAQDATFFRSPSTVHCFFFCFSFPLTFLFSSRGLTPHRLSQANHEPEALCICFCKKVLRALVMTECSLEANHCQLHTGQDALKGPLFVLHVSRLVTEVLERNRELSLSCLAIDSNYSLHVLLFITVN